MTRRAYYELSYQRLQELLKLPQNTTIITTVDDVMGGMLRVVIEHPALPEVLEASPLQCRAPAFRVVGPPKPEELEFKEWL